MLYLTCITITSVDLAHYGVSRAKDWASVDCGTNYIYDGFKGSVPPQHTHPYKPDHFTADSSTVGRVHLSF